MKPYTRQPTARITNGQVTGYALPQLEEIFLIFISGLVVVKNILAINSRSSRLGRQKFQFGQLRELAGNCLIRFAVFCAKAALIVKKRKNSRLHGKNRELGDDQNLTPGRG